MTLLLTVLKDASPFPLSDIAVRNGDGGSKDPEGC